MAAWHTALSISWYPLHPIVIKLDSIVALSIYNLYQTQITSNIQSQTSTACRFPELVFANNLIIVTSLALPAIRVGSVCSQSLNPVQHPPPTTHHLLKMLRLSVCDYMSETDRRAHRPDSLHCDHFPLSTQKDLHVGEYSETYKPNFCNTPYDHINVKIAIRSKWFVIWINKI